MAKPGLHLIYLHGFASSPGSNKAQKFAGALAARGLTALIPDLNEGDFTGLTITRQITLLRRLVAAHPSVILIGSSMGAYVSALFAASDPRVEALVLMAPAFGFIQRWTGRMSPQALTEWEQRGSMSVFHHATQTWQPIGWGLVQDARAYPAYPEVTIPTLVVHGRQDESVPVHCSQEFASGRPCVVLELLDSDHSLADSIDWIIRRALQFLAPWLTA